MFCEHCGERIPDDSAFCEYCGGAVTGAAPAASEPRQAAPEPAFAPRRAAAAPVPEPRPAPAPAAAPRRSGKGVVVALVAVIAIAAAGIGAFLLLGGEGTPPAPNGTAGSASSALPASSAGAAASSSNSAATDAEPGPDASKPSTPRGQELSTKTAPTLEEFAWYDEVSRNGLWADVAPATDFDEMLGWWKCYIVYDPSRTMDSHARELAVVQVTGTEASAEMAVDGRMIYFEGAEPFDESDQPPFSYTGTYGEGGFELTGSGNVSIGEFFYRDGKQYGLGVLLTPDGIPADFYLMRP